MVHAEVGAAMVTNLFSSTKLPRSQSCSMRSRAVSFVDFVLLLDAGFATTCRALHFFGFQDLQRGQFATPATGRLGILRTIRGRIRWCHGATR